jgi:hypothetical protein
MFDRLLTRRASEEVPVYFGGRCKLRIDNLEGLPSWKFYPFIYVEDETGTTTRLLFKAGTLRDVLISTGLSSQAGKITSEDIPILRVL